MDKTTDISFFTSAKILEFGSHFGLDDRKSKMATISLMSEIFWTKEEKLGISLLA